MGRAQVGGKLKISQKIFSIQLNSAGRILVVWKNKRVLIFLRHIIGEQILELVNKIIVNKTNAFDSRVKMVFWTIFDDFGSADHIKYPKNYRDTAIKAIISKESFATEGK